MPKHVPSFKHLLSSSYSPRRDVERPPEKSVKDLLSSARVNRPVVREIPPHIASGNERVWVPEVGTSTSGGLVNVEEGGIHPAEIARREYVARRQASRSTAGPVPPPSWRAGSSRPRSTGDGKLGDTNVDEVFPGRPVTTDDLRLSQAIFSVSPSITHLPVPSVGSASTGGARLVEYCFQAVLRYMEDETVVQDEDGFGRERYTLGDLVREQVPHLQDHLKAGLLEMAALQPAAVRERLSDRNIVAVLSPPYEFPAEVEDDSQSSTSWDTTRDEETLSTIHHLAVTLHSSPLSLLSRIRAMPAVSLTSLDLSFSTLPNDFETLVHALPAGLRELSLAGSSINPKFRRERWLQGIGALGSKMFVLRMLDLSFPPCALPPAALKRLLHPPATRLPSLRKLGLRGILDRFLETDDPDRERSRGWAVLPSTATDLGKECGAKKREYIEVVRGEGRKAWVDMVF